MACCHIPLYDSRPDQNPGDIQPDDYDPRYTTDYAHWQRSCFKLWGPLLDEAGCQLVISGHQHTFRYEPSNGEHGWAQLIGGGPVLTGPKSDDQFPTLFDVSVKAGKLKVVAYDMRDDSVIDRFEYKSRK